MTKDEAREILQKDGCGYGCFIPSRKNCNSTDCLLKEALTMAIKALEQQTCEDAVSREAAINAVNDVIADYVPNIFGRYEALPLEMASAINRLPPVNPQPKTGHWIKYGKLYQCSECKELSCCQGKFCNECGAKMVEPQESEVQDADCN